MNTLRQFARVELCIERIFGGLFKHKPEILLGPTLAVAFLMNKNLTDARIQCQEDKYVLLL